MEYEDEEDESVVNPAISIEMIKALGIDIRRIEDAVVEKIADLLVSQIEKGVDAKVAQKIDTEVGLKVSEWVTNVLSKPYQPINTWGEAKGAITTIQSVIEDNAANFMKQPVDHQGRDRDGYGEKKPRFIWAAEQVAQKAMEDAIKPEMGKLIVEMRRQITEGVGQVFQSMLTKMLGGK